MTYTLDTPYSNQVIFLNSQNSVLKTIDGVGQYQYNFQTPIQLPINCECLYPLQTHNSHIFLMLAPL